LHRKRRQKLAEDKPREMLELKKSFREKLGDVKSFMRDREKFHARSWGRRNA
jgi:hypothetical protein